MIQKILLVILGLNLVSAAVDAQPVINEVCFHNTGNHADENGDFHDWIELYNPGNTALPLQEFFINDEADFSGAWRLPSILLAPGAYLIILAAGSSETSAFLHAPFKLNNEGENVVLYNSSGQIIDVSPEVNIPANHTIGPDPHNDSQWLMFEQVTPGYANHLNNPVVAPIWWENIEISHSSGFQVFPLNIEFNYSNTEGELRYTVDGSIPTTSSPLYEESLRITGDERSAFSALSISTSDTWEAPEGTFPNAVLLKAALFRDGIRVSEIIERAFFNENTALHNSDFLTISLTSNFDNLFSEEKGIYVYGDHPFGNYHQSGDNWAREGKLEVISTDQVSWNGPVEFRIHGRSSRAYPQKSLRFYADHIDDDETFGFQPFEEATTFSRFMLKAPDRLFSQSLFVDELVQTLAEPLDIDLMRNKASVLYINGEYWGIHQLRERIDEKWIRQQYHFDEEIEIDILDFDRQLFIQNGNTETWNELVQWMDSHDPSSDNHIEQFAQWVDLSSFKDYMAVNLFFSNGDFPVNNVRLWKARTSESKWRFILFDCDACALDAHYNEGENLLQDADGNDPVSKIFGYLMKNERFRQEFLIHALDISTTYWRPELIMNKVDSFIQVIQPEIGRQTRRWHYPESMSAWDRSIQDLNAFAIQRMVNFQSQLGHSLSSPFALYPVPANDFVNIALLSGEAFEAGTIRLRDLRGSILKEYSLTGENTVWTLHFDDIPPGMYLLDLSYGGLVFSHRWIKN